MMLGRPRVLEPTAVGELDVVELVLQRLVLVAHLAVAPMLRVVHVGKDAELHVSSVWARAAGGNSNRGSVEATRRREPVGGRCPLRGLYLPTCWVPD